MQEAIEGVGMVHPQDLLIEIALGLKMLALERERDGTLRDIEASNFDESRLYEFLFQIRDLNSKYGQLPEFTIS